MSAHEVWRRFWKGPGGGGEVLSLSYPLILSQMSFTVQVFVDRLFLTWYSREAMAAVQPAVSRSAAATASPKTQRRPRDRSCGTRDLPL